MNNESDIIKTFLAKSPTLSEILQFVESESRRIAEERRKAGQGQT